METIFFILLFASIYSYLIYPILLYLLKIIAPNPWAREDIRPSVTIIISAYNEENIIEEKIKNMFSLDYPKELLKVLVSSDGSTDRTNEIVSGIKDSRLVLRAFQERAGKTTGLNRVIPDATGEIILFTDANAIFPSDLLVKLVRNFAGPDVVIVTGWTKYAAPGGGEAVTGIYSRLEKWTKHCESLISSCVGADGAVFAIKKSFFQPLDPVEINDFVLPLHVIKYGKRAVLDSKVFCFEDASERGKTAYQRQVRITVGALWGIRRNISLINVLKFGFSSFFLFSHNVMRLLVPFFFVGGFIINIVLLLGSLSPLYTIILLGYILFVVIGILNMFGIFKGRVSKICKIFLITLSAQITGWIKMLSGHKDTIWTPQR